MRTQDPKMIEILEYPPTESEAVALLIVVIGIILTLLGLAGLVQGAVWSSAGWAIVFFGVCTSVLGTILRNAD